MNWEELRKRAISGILFGIVALIIILKGGVLFVIFVSALSFLASIEFYTLFDLRGKKGYKELGMMISTLIIFCSYFLNRETLFGIFTLSVISILVLNLWFYELGLGGGTDRVFITYFGILYLGWLPSHAIFLRNSENGLQLTILSISSTVAGDIGAYFGGKFFGKTKIAPQISPGKTWEGFIFGILSSVLVSSILGKIFGFYLFSLIVYGFLIGIFGFLGDLTESMIKRELKVKDSGTLLPGHGGFLDRLDSVIFTLPFTFYVRSYLF